MNQETANLMSLGECDEELRKKIEQDIERVVVAYIQRNSYDIGAAILTNHASNFERLALRALKQHFINASNIY